MSEKAKLGLILGFNTLFGLFVLLGIGDPQRALESIFIVNAVGLVDYLAGIYTPEPTQDNREEIIKQVKFYLEDRQACFMCGSATEHCAYALAAFWPCCPRDKADFLALSPEEVYASVEEYYRGLQNAKHKDNEP